MRTMIIISYTLHKLGRVCKRWSPSWLWRVSSATTTEKQVIEKSKTAQGCAPRKIEGSPVLRTCKIRGAQHMICMKNLRFSSRPWAKVWRKGPMGSAKAQSCFLQYINCKWVQKWIYRRTIQKFLVKLMPWLLAQFNTSIFW